MTIAPDDTLFLYNATEIKVYKLKLFSTAQVPPTAQNDSYTCVSSSLTVTAGQGVLSNDSDLNFDPITAALLTNPNSGSVVLNADGSFTYTPNAGFSGQDSFTYKALDATSSSIATVTITVDPLAVTAVSPSSGFAGTLVTNVTLSGHGFNASTPVLPSGTIAFNGHSYLFVNSAMTWTNAQAYCIGLSGHLVTIGSSAENAFVQNLSNVDKWIGFTDQAVEGTFVWVTGETKGLHQLGLWRTQ